MVEKTAIKDGLNITLRGVITKKGMHKDRAWFEVSWLGGMKRFYDALPCKEKDIFEGELSVNQAGYWNIEKTTMPVVR